jgi:hypothetical protein
MHIIFTFLCIKTFAISLGGAYEDPAPTVKTIMNWRRPSPKDGRFCVTLRR